MNPIGVFRTIGNAPFILVETTNNLLQSQDNFILVALEDIELRRFPNRDLQIIPPYDQFIAITSQTEDEDIYIQHLKTILPVVHQDENATIYAPDEEIKSKNNKNRRKGGIAPLIEGL